MCYYNGQIRKGRKYLTMDENKIILIVYKRDEAAYQRLAKQITYCSRQCFTGVL